MIPLVLLPIAILILAAYGTYAIISATLSPWHALGAAAAVAGLLLAFHLLWILIGNLRKPSQ
jgi:hypothetical protein